MVLFYILPMVPDWANKVQEHLLRSCRSVGGLTTSFDRFPFLRICSVLFYSVLFCSVLVSLRGPTANVGKERQSLCSNEGAGRGRSKSPTMGGPRGKLGVVDGAASGEAARKRQADPARNAAPRGVGVTACGSAGSFGSHRVSDGGWTAMSTNSVSSPTAGRNITIRQTPQLLPIAASSASRTEGWSQAATAQLNSAGPTKRRGNASESAAASLQRPEDASASATATTATDSGRTRDRKSSSTWNAASSGLDANDSDLPGGVLQHQAGACRDSRIPSRSSSAIVRGADYLGGCAGVVGGPPPAAPQAPARQLRP